MSEPQGAAAPQSTAPTALVFGVAVALVGLVGRRLLAEPQDAVLLRRPRRHRRESRHPETVAAHLVLHSLSELERPRRPTRLGAELRPELRLGRPPGRGLPPRQHRAACRFRAPALRSRPPYPGLAEGGRDRRAAAHVAGGDDRGRLGRSPAADRARHLHDPEDRAAGRILLPGRALRCAADGGAACALGWARRPRLGARRGQQGDRSRHPDRRRCSTTGCFASRSSSARGAGCTWVSPGPGSCCWLCSPAVSGRACHCTPRACLRSPTCSRRAACWRATCVSWSGRTRW